MFEHRRGAASGDHELGLEPQCDLVLVVPRGPVELDAEPEVAASGSGGRQGGGEGGVGEGGGQVGGTGESSGGSG